MDDATDGSLNVQVRQGLVGFQTRRIEAGAWRAGFWGCIKGYVRKVVGG